MRDSRSLSRGTIRLLAVALTALFGATELLSTTYYWKGGGYGTFGLYDDLANWSTESSTGVDAEVLPGEADTLDPKTSCSFNLNGGEWTLKSWDPVSDWDRRGLGLTNGTLTFTTSVQTHSGTISIWDGATLNFAKTAQFVPALNDAGTRYVDVLPGGTFNFYGTYYCYHGQVLVKQGGTATIDPVSWGGQGGSQQADNLLSNAGTLNLPSGLVYKTGGANSNYKSAFKQTGGVLNLGGPISRGNVSPANMVFYIVFSGGLVNVEKDAFFLANSVSVTAEVPFNVAEGATLTADGVTFSDGIPLIKEGPGAVRFTNALPAAVTLKAGDLRLEGEPRNITLNVDATEPGGRIVLAAKDLTLEGFVADTVTFGVDTSIVVHKDTVLHSPSEELLDRVEADLLAAGFNISREGDALVLYSSYTFSSTETTDLNDPAGWFGGTLPPAGQGVILSGAGVQAVIDAEIPAWSYILVTDGASLTIAGSDMELPTIVLEGDTHLEITGSATLPTPISTKPDSDGRLPSIHLAPGGSLTLPGGSAFKNCRLTLEGELKSSSDGQFIFGTADADETAHFALVANGATISASNAAGMANAARIDFAVPTAGGTVVLDEPIVLKNCAFAYNSLDGFAFGLNNPVDTPVEVIVDNTPLNIGGETYVSGSAHLVLTNGSVLLRQRHSENGAGYNINVENKGRITLVDGGEIRGGVTMINGDLTNGAVRLQPDEEGYASIVIGEGGIACWYKLNGYGKGVVRVEDGIVECFKTFWWGWPGNREHILNNLLSVEIPAGKTMTYRGVPQKLYSNYDELSGTTFESPFSGEGNLIVENTRSGTTLQPTICRNDNTCTGTLSVSPDNGTAKARVQFADGANWAGMVILDGRIGLKPVDLTYSSSASKPTTATFGGAYLTSPFSLRCWIAIDENGDCNVTNDMVHIGALGWNAEPGATLALVSQNSLDISDIPIGTELVIGRMPKDGAIPESAEPKVALLERAIDGNEEESILVAKILSADGFVFNGGSETITDLNDPSGYADGIVPVGKAIQIDGTTAIVDATHPLPEFTAITLRNGAVLNFVGKTEEGTAFTLPTIKLDPTSALRIGDDAATATTVNLTVAPIAVGLAGSEGLPRIIIEKGSTLGIPGGTKFANVAIEHYGTMAWCDTVSGGVTIGYAVNGETTRIAYTGVGGRFDFRANQNATAGRVAFLTPASGGRVQALGDILLQKVTSAFDNWSNFGERYFGVNNPTDEPFTVVLDNTQFNITWSAILAGGARMLLRNGARFGVLGSCYNHGFGSTVKEQASIVV